MLKAIVIDDELFAREELIEQLNEIGHIDIIAECGNAIDGLKQINQLKQENPDHSIFNDLPFSIIIYDREHPDGISFSHGISFSDST